MATFEYPSARVIDAQRASLWFYPDRCDYVFHGAVDVDGAVDRLGLGEPDPGVLWSSTHCALSTYHYQTRSFTSMFLSGNLSTPVVRVERGPTRLYVFTLLQLMCFEYALGSQPLWTIDMFDAGWWRQDRSTCCDDTVVARRHDGKKLRVWIGGVAETITPNCRTISHVCLRNSAQLIYATTCGHMFSMSLCAVDGRVEAAILEVRPLTQGMRVKRAGYAQAFYHVTGLLTSERFAVVMYEVHSAGATDVRKCLVYDFHRETTHQYAMHDDDVMVGMHDDVVRFVRAPPLDLRERERRYISQMCGQEPLSRDLERLITRELFAISSI